MSTAHISIRKFGVCKAFDVFENNILCSPRLHLFVQKCTNTVILSFSIQIYFKMLFIPVKLYFQHHYSSLQCHMIFHKSFKYANLLLMKHFLFYYQCCKQCAASCFCVNRDTCHFWVFWWIEQQISDIEFFNTVTFDQFNASFLNRSINLFQNKQTTSTYEQ